MSPRGQRLYNRCLQLGYKDIEPQPHAEMLDFAAQHFGYVFQKNKTQDKAVELVPRGCFKTSCCTVAGTIDTLAENPNLRFLWCTHTHDYTKQILGEAKWHYERNEELRSEIGDVKTGSPKWAEESIILSTRTKTAKEPSIDTCGLDNPKVGGHYDVIIVDDIHTRENITERMLRKARHFIADLFPVLEPGGLLYVIGCFASGTPILKSDGVWAPIESLTPGTLVRTESGDHPVLAVIDQGFARTVTVRTRRAVWRCTPNHPFLVWRGSGKEWVRAEELCKGDQLVCQTRSDTYAQVPWTPDDRPFDADDAYVYGVLLGDGWVGNGSRPYIGVAGSKEELPQHVARFSRYGRAYTTAVGSVRVDSAEWARWFSDRGISGGAKGKRIQEWVFTLPLSLQRAVLRGLCDADGCYSKSHPNLCSLELHNENLIEDVRALAKVCGIHATLCGHRSRTSYIKMRRKSYEVDAYRTALNFDPARYAMSDMVQSVDIGPELRVWDLSIDEDPSYVANGVVVHNTRWHMSDVYAWIYKQNEDLEKLGQAKKKWSVLRRGCFDGPDNLYFPSRLTKEFVEEQRLTLDDKTFAAQYLNQAISEEAQLFPPSLIKTFDGKFNAPEGGIPNIELPVAA
ncbi:MAG: hypothetical protein KGL39_12900 [Patescibacteria group bacterium]|nr:hypothetical protein [Patescibacteria group bacterium]